MEVRHAAGQDQVIHYAPIEVSFNAFRNSVPDVIDRGEAVYAGQGILNVLPSLEKDVPIDNESVIEPTRFPAKLKVRQSIRHILGWRHRLSQGRVTRIAAARSEAGRIREIQEMLRIDFPAEATLQCFAVLVL